MGKPLSGERQRRVAGGPLMSVVFLVEITTRAPREADDNSSPIVEWRLHQHHISSTLSRLWYERSTGGRGALITSAGHGQELTAQEFFLAFFSAEIRAWHREERLWKVFWAYGVGSSGGLAILYAAAMYAAQIVLQQVLLLCFAAYTIWILVAVWRCAKNAQTS